MADERKSLTHLDEEGRARMVDVSAKPESRREASASGNIRMERATLDAILEGTLPKGDVMTVARLAGIMAAKQTSSLIPLCHPVPLHDVQVEIEGDETLPGLRVRSSAATIGRTGVEMEAITAVAVTLVTIYDMAKAVDRAMVIGDIALDRKTGGVRGDYARA